MEENNPYSSLEAPAAAFAVASERAAFLKKVYGILFLGMLGFAATLWAAASVPVVHDLAMSFAQLIYGRGIMGMVIYMAIFFGGSYAVHALAEKSPINIVAYAAWVVLMAFFTAPIVFMANAVGGAAILHQASALTAIVFGGLTVFVLYTGKDFSWLRGVLWVAFLGIMGAMLLGWLMGFSMGLWLSVAIVIFSAGHILYDTSNILHKLPTSMAMSGAIMLFTDVVLLFKHILILLMSSRD